ncbi:MAG: hypothetical protein HZB51_00620 [Chloroflexi bacterium]|nr:hypothetical protein [Chloroflexota bacterium]
MEKESQDHHASSLPYANTMEHRAASLVGQKLAAAQLLYGDSVEGALVEQSDSGHGFLADLARSVIEEADVPDLGCLFRQISVCGNGHTNVSGAFIGSSLQTLTSDATEILAGSITALSEPPVLVNSVSTRQMALF